MKKLVVMSDTHVRPGVFRRVLNHEKQVDALFFTGDGGRDLEFLETEFPRLAVYQVHGNCDFGSLFPAEGLASFEGVLFFYTHGHNYNVKYELTELARAAAARGADVALFGHTHLPTLEQIDTVTLFNPGSAGAPRFSAPTYGVITVEKGKPPRFEHKQVPPHE